MIKRNESGQQKRVRSRVLARAAAGGVQNNPAGVQGRYVSIPGAGGRAATRPAAGPAARHGAPIRLDRGASAAAGRQSVRGSACRADGQYAETARRSSSRVSSAAWRRRRQLRRKLSRILFPVALLAIVLAWATHSRLFAIRTELVEGNTITPSDLILRAANVPMRSNLLLVSSRAVRRRLSSLPAVTDVHVTHRFPHTLILSVEEAAPWAAVQSGGSVFLVDAQLKVIARAANLPRLPVVVVSGAVSPEPLQPGSGIHGTLLVAALRLARLAQDPLYGVSVPRVFIDPNRKLWLNINGSGKALVGTPQDLGAKLSALRTIVRRSPDLLSRAAYLDMQNPASPAYVPRPVDFSAGGAVPLD